MRTKEQSYDITSLPNPNASRLSKTQKVGFAVGGALLGIGALNMLPSDDTLSNGKTDSVVCYGSQDTEPVVVKSGDGEDDVVVRAYGADDKRTVLNNICYEAQVAAVQDQIGEGMLQPGKIDLPANILPADQLPK